MKVYEYQKITSNSIGINITLRDLIDQPIQTKTVKVIEVFINEGDYVYNCYIALKILNQGELIELYNRWPGQIDEVYIKENDLIGLDSVIYNIRGDFRQDLQIEYIQYGVINKRNQNFRINIIKNEEEHIPEQGDKIQLDPKMILGHKDNVFKVVMNDGKMNDINFQVMKNKYPHLVVQYLEKL
ncbi:unnamed protein product [Paramecium pentaurelia]|uniref:Uncharacterized protein n=1 Tax=Paramecium pentaurelia TaxID=43138 RepID=A0A8S1XXI9_9CILI|nr:unnamed protein product [Paramecium pentaurelia]